MIILLKDYSVSWDLKAMMDDFDFRRANTDIGFQIVMS